MKGRDKKAEEGERGKLARWERRGVQEGGE